MTWDWGFLAGLGIHVYVVAASVALQKASRLNQLTNKGLPVHTSTTSSLV
jgi:hypothetical protein